MDFSGEQKISAPRRQVWEALNDPDVLKACISGCESLEKNSNSNNEMKAVVLAKFGPVKTKFKADINIEDIEDACSCKLVGKGQGSVGGFANGVANITLKDDGDDTLLRYVVDFSVGEKNSANWNTSVKWYNHKNRQSLFCYLPRTVVI